MKHLLMIIGLLGLVACAHHRDVRPGTKGLHRVTVKSEDTSAGSRDAISQANHFCKEKMGGKTAAFTKEGSKYTGDVDEDTYKAGKKVSKAAQIIGGSVAVFGGKRESKLGSAAGVGGTVGDAVLGKGYTVEMKFKCI